MTLETILYAEAALGAMIAFVVGLALRRVNGRSHSLSVPFAWCFLALAAAWAAALAHLAIGPAFLPVVAIARGVLVATLTWLLLRVLGIGSGEK